MFGKKSNEPAPAPEVTEEISANAPVEEPAPAEAAGPAPAEPAPAEAAPARKPKMRYIIPRGSFTGHTSIAIMLFAVIFCLLGIKGHTDSDFYLMTQVALPAVSGLLFILFTAFLGDRALWTTLFGVLGGVVFFLFRIWCGSYPIWQQLLCSALYAAVLVIYFCTVTGKIRTRVLLMLVSGLPLCYHVFVEDIYVTTAEGTVGGIAKLTASGELFFSANMQELSVLCIMLALFFAAFAMKKVFGRGPGGELPPDLPRMDGPRVRQEPGAPGAPEGPHI